LNGFPNAKQERFHKRLREMGCIVSGKTIVQIHHIVGARWKAKGFKKPGEWLVLPLHEEVHDDIKDYDFNGERNLYLANLEKYEIIFGEPHPVPEGLINYLKAMKNRYDVPKGFYA